jgi:hypothetical protein
MTLRGRKKILDTRILCVEKKEICRQVWKQIDSDLGIIYLEVTHGILKWTLMEGGREGGYRETNCGTQKESLEQKQTIEPAF